MITLKEGERLDDLQRDGLMLIQNPDIFCFGIDAVLLSSFALVKRGDTVLDMCTGNGVIPILLAGKSRADRIYGLEIQEYPWDMACRSVDYNDLTDRVSIIKGDVKNADEFWQHDSMNVITCNPPYLKGGGGLVNPEDVKAVARHEILCTLEDIISKAALLLKMRGRFYMVHRPQRLVDILYLMRKYAIEPKTLQLVESFKGKEPTLVLVEGVKGGGAELKIKSPLTIYEEPGKYTEEVLKMYNDVMAPNGE